MVNRSNVERPAVNRSSVAQSLGGYSANQNSQQQLATGRSISQMAMDSSNFGGGAARGIGLAAQLATAGIGAYAQYKAQKDLNEQEFASQQAFAKQFPHLADIASTLSPETRQSYSLEALKASLKSPEPQSSIGKIAADYQSGIIDDSTYRSAIKKESSFAPDSSSYGGATGAIVNNLRRENPNLTYAQALSQAQGLARQGLEFDASGNVAPMAGLLDSKSASKAAESEGAEVGKGRGEARSSLNSQESKLPELERTVKELGELSKKATYTKTGQARDFALREAGLPMSEGGNARAEYISKVDNQVLPLLRDIFGAAFTQKEGDTLRATLGDPNKSPTEKEVILKSFITQKKASIESTKRQLGDTDKATNSQSQASGKVGNIGWRLK
jgi:hypothetical protein